MGPQGELSPGLSVSLCRLPDTTRSAPEHRESDLDLVPPLELCIRTK